MKLIFTFKSVFPVRRRIYFFWGILILLRPYCIYFWVYNPQRILFENIFISCSVTLVRTPIFCNSKYLKYFYISDEMGWFTQTMNIDKRMTLIANLFRTYTIFFWNKYLLILSIPYLSIITSSKLFVKCRILFGRICSLDMSFFTQYSIISTIDIRGSFSLSKNLYKLFLLTPSRS